MTHLAAFRPVDYTRSAGSYPIRFPQADMGHAQDLEFCEVLLDGRWVRIRFHDYHQIYAYPGLYESIFYSLLKCTSPRVVCGMLMDQVHAAGETPSNLRVLDFGAGNGMVGEELRRYGIAALCGVDILCEAEQAQQRDRPGLYDRYVVADFTQLDEPTEHALRQMRFNALTSVAALGFGDIPPRAFLKALDLVEEEGWIAFNIKEQFLTGDRTGFAGLIRTLSDAGYLQMTSFLRYNHRMSIAGRKLYYLGIIARKLRPLDEAVWDMVEF
mgnify:CR=1 FL=1